MRNSVLLLAGACALLAGPTLAQEPPQPAPPGDPSDAWLAQAIAGAKPARKAPALPPIDTDGRWSLRAEPNPVAPPSAVYDFGPLDPMAAGPGLNITGETRLEHGRKLSLFARLGGALDRIAPFGLAKDRDDASQNWSVGAQYLIDEHHGVRVEYLRESFSSQARDGADVIVSLVRKF